LIDPLNDKDQYKTRSKNIFELAVRIAFVIVLNTLPKFKLQVVLGKRVSLILTLMDLLATWRNFRAFSMGGDTISCLLTFLSFIRQR
jgi:accessory gene regulator protein AgrB